MSRMTRATFLAIKLPLACAITGVFVILALSNPAYAGATITIVNRDGAGEGFNDPGAPDPASTAGGNNGATLGAQRLNAAQRAADIWAGILNSNVEIRIDTNFNPLSCGSSSATLAEAGPNFVWRDFTGAPVANTWYVEAQANSLFGSKLPSGANDMVARFNSTVGTTCSFPRGWYYGLDRNPPANGIDFVTVFLHEIAHGLGFLSLVDLSSGEKFLGIDDAYTRNLENHRTGELYPAMTDSERVLASEDTGDLHWVGPAVTAASADLTSGRHPSGHVEMYAPSPQRPGSSVSHFSDSLFPDDVQEPFHTGPDHNVDRITALLNDLGWSVVEAVDTDGDGVPDSTDNCPSVANPDQTNTDGDAAGNACDADDDNDGMSDDEEIARGRNPLVNEIAVLMVILNAVLASED